MRLSELQARVKELDSECGWTGDTPLQNLAHLSEEIGEIARLLLADEGYKNDEEFSQERLAEELSDSLYLIAKLANKFNVNLGDAWLESEKRYLRESNG